MLGCMQALCNNVSPTMQFFGAQPGMRAYKQTLGVSTEMVTVLTRDKRTAYSNTSFGMFAKCWSKCAGEARTETMAAPAELKNSGAPDMHKGAQNGILCTPVTYAGPWHNARKLQMVVLDDVHFQQQHIVHCLQIEAFFYLCIGDKEHVECHH